MLVLIGLCAWTGCFRWSFDSSPRSSFRNPLVQNAAVGGQLQLARGDGDTSVRVTTQPMCRSMRTGRRVTIVETHRRWKAGQGARAPELG